MDYQKQFNKKLDEMVKLPFELQFSDLLRQGNYSVYIQEFKKFEKEKEEEIQIRINKAKVADLQAYYDSITGRVDDDDD